MDIARFKKLPIMGILRGVDESSIAPLVEAIGSAGLETVEITMNTKNAGQLISAAVKISGHRLMIGAGKSRARPVALRRGGLSIRQSRRSGAERPPGTRSSCAAGHHPE